MNILHQFVGEKKRNNEKLFCTLDTKRVNFSELLLCITESLKHISFLFFEFMLQVTSGKLS